MRGIELRARQAVLIVVFPFIWVINVIHDLCCSASNWYTNAVNIWCDDEGNYNNKNR